ncbi:Abi family protein [Ideonella sp. B508-1]|uniref:Abi family protein n=1 Tax=Ideonella sp. B508-1 TaxID=137716 RepID=UPI00034C7D2C|nr:Abi family protein [Ideonella sp. B508-1]
MATAAKTLRAFTKPASTPEQQLQKLKNCGLAVADDAQALSYLRGVGAYRLKGYWHQVQDPTTKRFPAGYAFEDIRQRCELDRELRAATIEAIDRLEVAIRSTIANHLSLTHSPHWFLDHQVFKPTQQWGIGHMIRKVEDEVGRAKGKSFVKHYFENHDDPYLPPSWAISECVSFGMWSRTYSILRDQNDKKTIAKRFGVDLPEVFQSWIHALTVLRNSAAHHAQFLGVHLGVAPAAYRRERMLFAHPSPSSRLPPL